MTKDQESFFAMALKVKNFYAKNTVAIGTLAAVVPFYTQLQTLISQLITADTGSRADISGYAQMKAAKRKALETLAQKVSNGLSSYALIQGDMVLQKRADFTASSWYKITEEDLVTQATIVSNLATPLATNLVPYMVAAVDVTNLAAAITNFITVISDPTLAIDSRKQDNIDVLHKMDEIRTLLNDKTDVLMRGFELSNTNLFGLYTSARAIDINGATTEATVEKKVEPTAVVTLHQTEMYDPNTFYTIENRGDFPVNFSLSKTDNVAGPEEVLLEPGQTRSRLAENLNASGQFFIINNPNPEPVTVRLWVE